MLDLTSRTREAPAIEKPRGDPAFRDLIDMLPAAVYITDSQGCIDRYNRACVELWGREPEPGDRWCGSLHMFSAEGEAIAHDATPMNALLRGLPAPESVAVVIERPDGTRRDVIAHPRALRDTEGRIVGAVNVLIDVTEHSVAKSDLAAARRELAMQVESLTMLHDLAMRLGGMQELSPALQAVLDTAVAAQEADFGFVWLHHPERGELVVEASHGFDDAALRLFDSVAPGPAGGGAGNAFSRGQRWIIEDIERDPGFAPYRESARRAGFRALHSTPIVTRSGELLGVISVHFVDRRVPTPRHMQLADLCARHAADRIEAFRSEKRLRDSEAELRGIDERKNEFLATLAHELRNPLAPLRNGLEVMKLAQNDPRTVEKARGMMERQLQQMVRLVDDLLDVSRVSRGKIELRREDVELATVLGNAIETCQPLMAERGHRFAARIPAEPIVVNGDVTRLAQVFWNLLNNAARYTPPGGQVELEVVPGDGSVAVAVRDNGIGIPAEMRARVFEMFTQVDRSLEKSQGGLGIGLSIARRLVEMHGGTIEVASRGEGAGSEFTVRLPARTLVAKPQAPENAARERKAPARRILIADDNADAAATLSILLQALGHDVRAVEDGESAVIAAASFKPDVILLDIGMPRLNGYAACERIRAMPFARDAHLVALTGWGQEQDKQRSRLAGFDTHMVKPVEPAALQELLEKLPAPKQA